MPYFITEFSKNLDKEIDMQQIMKICLNAAKDSQLFDMKTAEARAHEVPYGLTIDGAPVFLHVKIAMFPGRTDAQKTALSKAIFDGITPIATQADNISVNVVDIEPHSFSHN